MYFMKNINLILNIILLGAVGTLYFLFFKNNNNKKNIHNTLDNASFQPVAGSIAYFNMDSLEKHYEYIKDVKTQLKTKEQSISDELNGLKKGYMGRIEQLQAKAQTMSQQEGQAAQEEINQMQQSLQQKEAMLTQSLQDQQFKMMQDVNKKIEDYLKEYNQKRKFSFIFSHQPGDFIYYKDSLYNITDDIVSGLNSDYKKTPKQ